MKNFRCLGGDLTFRILFHRQTYPVSREEGKERLKKRGGGGGGGWPLARRERGEAQFGKVPSTLSGGGGKGFLGRYKFNDLRSIQIRTKYQCFARFVFLHKNNNFMGKMRNLASKLADPLATRNLMGGERGGEGISPLPPLPRCLHPPPPPPPLFFNRSFPSSLDTGYVCLSVECMRNVRSPPKQQRKFFILLSFFSRKGRYLRNNKSFSLSFAKREGKEATPPFL